MEEACECHQVYAKQIYQPKGLMITSWFKRWTIQCGSCGRDFERFKFFGPKLKCPYCLKVNVVQLTEYP